MIEQGPRGRRVPPESWKASSHHSARSRTRSRAGLLGELVLLGRQLLLLLLDAAGAHLDQADLVVDHAEHAAIWDALVVELVLVLCRGQSHQLRPTMGAAQLG